jgi:hypothetical protein
MRERRWMLRRCLERGMKGRRRSGLVVSFFFPLAEVVEGFVDFLYFFADFFWPVVRDVEEEELLFQGKKARKAMRQAAVEEEVKEEVGRGEEGSGGREGSVKVETVNGATFY